MHTIFGKNCTMYQVRSTMYKKACELSCVGLRQACFLFNRSLGRKVKKPHSHIVKTYVSMWFKKASLLFSSLCCQYEGSSLNANFYFVPGTWYIVLI